MTSPFYDFEEESLEEAMEAKGWAQQYASVQPAPDLGFNGILNHIYESECAYSAIMLGVQRDELAFYNETGTILFESNQQPNSQYNIFKRMIDSIVEFFKKQLERLASVWKWAIDRLNTLDIANKAFLKEYEKVKEAKTLKDVEKFKGYRFQDLETLLKNLKPHGQDFSPDEIEKGALPDNWVEDRKKSIFAEIFGRNANTTERNDFVAQHDMSKIAESIKKMVYGDEVELGPCELNDWKNVLEGHTKSDRKLLNQKGFKPIQAKMNAYVLMFNTMKARDMVVPGEKNARIENLKKYIEVAKFNTYILNTVFAIFSRAIIDRNTQARQILAIAMGKAKPQNESAITRYHFRDQSLDNILASLG